MQKGKMVVSGMLTLKIFILNIVLAIIYPHLVSLNFALNVHFCVLCHFTLIQILAAEHTLVVMWYNFKAFLRSLITLCIFSSLVYLLPSFNAKPLVVYIS